MILQGAHLMALTADCFDLNRNDLVSARIGKPVARARQIAMWVMRSETALSLPAIGRMFGDRDHTTVLHACRRIEELRCREPHFHRLTEDILEWARLVATQDRSDAMHKRDIEDLRAVADRAIARGGEAAELGRDVRRIVDGYCAGVRHDVGVALSALHARARDMGFAEHSLPPSDR
jgi:hypothetical protein